MCGKLIKLRWLNKYALLSFCLSVCLPAQAACLSVPSSPVRPSVRQFICPSVHPSVCLHAFPRRLVYPCVCVCVCVYLDVCSSVSCLCHVTALKLQTEISMKIPRIVKSTRSSWIPLCDVRNHNKHEDMEGDDQQHQIQKFGDHKFPEVQVPEGNKWFVKRWQLLMADTATDACRKIINITSLYFIDLKVFWCWKPLDGWHINKVRALQRTASQFSLPCSQFQEDFCSVLKLWNSRPTMRTLYSDM